jgi:hypothetical protein
MLIGYMRVSTANGGVVPWRVWEPTHVVQFHAQSEASASKKPAVWAWNPNYRKLEVAIQVASDCSC